MKNGALDPYSYLFWSWGQDKVFHNLPAESQAEHLINFLLKWSVGEPEPSEPFEQDPE